MEKYLQKIIANGTEFKINSPVVVTWDSSSNMNDYVEAGIYELTGEKLSSEDNLPIINNGVISGKLTVLTTDDGKGSVVVNQILSLNNNGGGEGNVFIRSKQFDVWRSWGKLQTNVEVGAIGIGQSKTFDDLIDNGIYSGVNVYWEDQSAYITGYETFVLVVINGYLTGAGISQLKYSTKTNGTTSIETRTFLSDTWTAWSSSMSQEATTDTAGGVKLGYSNNDGWFPIGTIEPIFGSGLGLQIDSSVFDINRERSIPMLELNLEYLGGLNSSGGLGINIGSKLNVSNFNAVPLCMGTPANSDRFEMYVGGKNPVSVPLIPVHPDQFVLGNYGLEMKNSDNSTKVTWDSSSNMNNFKTPGVYDIYGERTKQDDNLPILNASSGHSIAARLTVVASTLQPANNEICLTQFLMLSNRKGGDGNMYIRTYNENNSPTENGWTPWKKLSGSEEGYIFTNNRRLNQDWGLQTVEVGLNWMVDNGNYSGVYVNEEAILQKGDLDSNGNGWGEINTDMTKITYVETFNITTINDYAVAGQVNNMLDQLGNQLNMDMSAYKKERQICQFKMATDLFSGTSSFKKRVYTGNDTDYGNNDKWSDWEDISGGGSGSNEVDVTDVVKAAGLPTLISQGYAKEGVTYKIYCPKGDFANIVLDKNKKLSNKIINDTANSPSWAKVLFNVHFIKNETGSDFIHITGKYYTDVNVKEFVINGQYTVVKVSADMTAL